MHSVSANKCLLANVNGAKYQLGVLGTCSSAAARWRVWWDAGQLHSFMLESLYYPGDCLAYGASTLAPCGSDYVKSGWWVSSASGQHRELTGYPSLTYCASVDSSGAMTSSDCQTPSVGWQQWDFQ